MGHDGMLYSLPSRDLIADSVEYMVEAHCADALVCISNCDKITPGMLNAAMRLNIPFRCSNEVLLSRFPVHWHVTRPRPLWACCTRGTVTTRDTWFAL